MDRRPLCRRLPALTSTKLGARKPKENTIFPERPLFLRKTYRTTDSNKGLSQRSHSGRATLCHPVPHYLPAASPARIPRTIFLSFGSASAALRADRSALACIKGIGTIKAGAIVSGRSQVDVEKELNPQEDGKAEHGQDEQK